VLDFLGRPAHPSAVFNFESERRGERSVLKFQAKSAKNPKSKGRFLKQAEVIGRHKRKRVCWRHWSGKKNYWDAQSRCGQYRRSLIEIRGNLGGVRGGGGKQDTKKSWLREGLLRISMQSDHYLPRLPQRRFGGPTQKKVKKEKKKSLRFRMNLTIRPMAFAPLSSEEQDSGIEPTGGAPHTGLRLDAE